MSIVIGFAPWIVYWVLVGNVPFETAVLVALAVAVAGLVIGRVHKAPGITFEIGAVAFLALTILTFTVSQGFMERWLQPLSNVGIFLVALGGVLRAGRSCANSPPPTSPRRWSTARSSSGSPWC